jgi:DNA-binding transcriptional regulator YdaS (Cro superfamily)
VATRSVPSISGSSADTSSVTVGFASAALHRLSTCSSSLAQSRTSGSQVPATKAKGGAPLRACSGHGSPRRAAQPTSVSWWMRGDAQPDADTSWRRLSGFVPCASGRAALSLGA